MDEKFLEWKKNDTNIHNFYKSMDKPILSPSDKAMYDYYTKLANVPTANIPDKTLNPVADLLQDQKNQLVMAIGIIVLLYLVAE